MFGRSVYLCYNNACIEAAFKKNRISKALKASVPEDLKGKLINEF
ncbi:MAG: YlxR family protein [Candidatus Gastranaerophilaceae bacterium]